MTGIPVRRRARRWRAPRILGPELPGRPLNVRRRWRWWRVLPRSPRWLSWLSAIISASLIAIPFFTYLAGPPPIEWGLFIALVPMGFWSWLAVVVGAVLWALGQEYLWVSALARGIVLSPVLAFLFVIVIGSIVGP